MQIFFADAPGKTSLATHHIAPVSDTKPVSLSPYRLHPEKAKLVQNEIDEMLKMGIITHLMVISYCDRAETGRIHYIMRRLSTSKQSYRTGSVSVAAC